MHFLKLIIISSFLLFISCDDGDILISDFEFDTENMVFCFSEESGDTVFYNANSDDEVIYLILENNEFKGEEETNAEYTVGSSTIVKYLKFSSDLNADEYFCTAVASAETIERQLNGDGGTINITTNNEISLTGDEDGDGLTNEFEGYIEDTITDNFNTLLDSDNDGIPNFLDEDDDNDNVKTALEIYPKDETQDDIIPEGDEELVLEDLLDTDNDGAPDYLDEDDDQDGILTRFEFDPDNSNLPVSNRNNDDVPFYRDENSTTFNTQDQEIIFTNSYSIEYRTIVKTSNLELTNSDSSVIYPELFIGEETVTNTTNNKIVLNTDGTTFDVFSIDDDGNSPDDSINSGTIGLIDEDETDETN